MGEGEMACLQLASTQHGVISRKQARESGLTSRRLDHRCTTGRWDRMFPTVFRIEGTPQTHLQKLKALSLWLSAGFALSHETAAHLHGFSRFDEGAIEALCIRNVRKRRGVTIHRVETLSHKDIARTRRLRLPRVTEVVRGRSTAKQRARSPWVRRPALDVARDSRRAGAMSARTHALSQSPSEVIPQFPQSMWLVWKRLTGRSTARRRSCKSPYHRDEARSRRRRSRSRPMEARRASRPSSASRRAPHRLW